MATPDPRFEYLLRHADDGLILGQRLGEWCGHAPALEVDLSLANIALDLIGQATLFYAYAGEIEGAGRDADKLAFHRDALQFRNCLMVEQPNGDFGRTIARQFLFSSFQNLFYQALARSSDERMAGIAAKAMKETDYHVGLARDWVVRLGDGTAESHDRMVDAFDWHWRFVDEMFQMDAVDQSMVEAGAGVDTTTLRPVFDANLAETMTEAGLPQPTYPRPLSGGRKGHHGEHLGHVLAVMQHLPRSYPDASW